MQHVKKDDALMYELAISIATCSLASAGAASEEAVAGRFPAAAKLFNAAAGAQTCLHEDLLPQWITLGSETEVSQLPSEVAGPVAEAFRGLYLAHAQQMAVATALTKGASPANYSLLAKLCRGLKEEMQGFVEAMRSHAAAQYSKMNPSLTVFITFQMGIYESMMHYFWARLMWSKDKYGLAIAILHKAAAWAETRKYASAAVGIPDPADRSSPVKAVEKDILDYRGHLRSLLDEWEKDNRTVYFDSVPNSVKEEDLVTKGVVIKKPEAFVLESPEPVQLGPKARAEMRAPPPQVLPRFNSGSGLPPGFITPAPVALPPEDDLPPPVYAPQQLQRTDSDLAREMQAKFDMHGQ
uniref:BRO1 domain-containing protein n=1 Tax=Corethron hystrix TaxID=216773 RepID=A0A7S1BDU4_9STRA|mmetsp:Transcript_21759/g.49490  ORF Transcript_21759/g.49490 Transcript_21759/m.49490 type:complete len:353 (+) Transcript_21759:1117-2175(+)|eukprot:CAMPEP_0113327294 /NCGR_PEP_ID=MMETSP0010_2-20120614/19191_1 /TAXON_ID=216773 ORGANISM="Corethron hystrix, Strain 308" /NCGR_SAMPLE_ID=MMETSP0010_2 /ASSEMBLY_ACC=CAM_ASM_000155 /LENGTH=352 /DNA_ID=CAMNT_0000188109 /DNA_START=573 /DNA_END=1631 /DNA_ORIENTATION=+ /assembly_acc=CAM_ASM_000155